MPDRKKKKNPQGNNSFLDDFVIIDEAAKAEKEAQAKAKAEKKAAGA